MGREVSIYRSPEGQARVLALYDGFLNSLGIAYEDRMLETRFGATHVLVMGPERGEPVVIIHGGNSTNPQGLRDLLPLIEAERFRLYAPDTIGHPGLSAQVRLSPHDESYGQWLADVLDGLGLERAAFIGGSFGAGIILRLAAYTPERIAKAALFVPSGVVRVPFRSMVFRIGLPYLIFRLSPNRKRLLRAVSWMGDEMDDDMLALMEALFNHLRMEKKMPRPATVEELEGFRAPVLVIAAEKDALFPGDAVIRRAKEVIPNLVAAECLRGGTHLPSKRDGEYICRRIVAFMDRI
ncbi:MAG TPA: alpha/beta hydrolase [Spirochaetia bacterium]|nr:alpha/beta hydrolase [Spirochaetia bacterium]